MRRSLPGFFSTSFIKRGETGPWVGERAWYDHLLFGVLAIFFWACFFSKLTGFFRLFWAWGFLYSHRAWSFLYSHWAWGFFHSHWAFSLSRVFINQFFSCILETHAVFFGVLVYESFQTVDHFFLELPSFREYFILPFTF